MFPLRVGSENLFGISCWSHIYIYIYGSVRFCCEPLSGEHYTREKTKAKHVLGILTRFRFCTTCFSKSCPGHVQHRNLLLVEFCVQDKSQIQSHEMMLFGTSGSCLSKYGGLDSVQYMSCSGSSHYSICFRRCTQIRVAFLARIRTHMLQYARKQIEAARLQIRINRN